jgi:hypothetical protein
MEYKFDHFGVPVSRKKRGMIHYPEYKVWCSDYEKDPLRIEWIYFEKGTPLHPLLRKIPHVCYLVDDIKKAVRGKKILMKPVSYQGYWMAFVVIDQTPVEFIQPPCSNTAR